MAVVMHIEFATGRYVMMLWSRQSPYARVARESSIIYNPVLRLARLDRLPRHQLPNDGA